MRPRCYIVGDEGLKRVPLNVIYRREALPQFANSRIKAIQADYEWEDDRLLFSVLGTHLNFNEEGIVYVPRDELRNAAELVGRAWEIERERLEACKVTNIALHRRVKILKSERQRKPDAVARRLAGGGTTAGHIAHSAHQAVQRVTSIDRSHGLTTPLSVVSLSGTNASAGQATYADFIEVYGVARSISDGAPL